MNLELIGPKNQTEDLLLPIIKFCEKLFKQTHTKPKEALEFKLTKLRESFSFKPAINSGLDSN